MDYVDLLDDYLADRLPEEQKVAFEKQLEGDASLRQQLDTQKGIIEGLKQARVAELKTIMNNVPTGAWQTGGSSATIKIVAGLTVTSVLVVSTILWFNTQEKDSNTLIAPAEITESTELIEEERLTENETAAEFEKKQIESTQAKDRVSTTEQPPIKTEKKTLTPKDPTIDVLDFEDELDQANEPILPIISETNKEPIRLSNISLEIDNSDSKYDFHYQFREGKLILYGKFDKSIYEVLEFNANNEQLIFFYYKENFYELNKKQMKIAPLEAIKDATLLKKLNTHRLK